MSESDKTALKNMIDESVSSAVRKRMAGLYAIHSLSLAAMLSIFIAVAWPINDKVTNLCTESAQHATREYVYENYISKGQYIRLTEDEHKYDKQAIASPDNSSYIYMEHKQLLERDLGERYRGGVN